MVSVGSLWVMEKKNQKKKKKKTNGSKKKNVINNYVLPSNETESI
jgi:hypothetical protein